MLCQVKHFSKKIFYVAGPKVSTCPSCNTAQKINAVTTVASAWLCIEIDGKDTWLTAMDQPMQSLLAKMGFTKQTETQTIKEAFFELEDITLTYNTKSNFIINIE